MTSLRILVVEDNTNLALGLENNLKLEGYEVRVASDGRQGLDLARRFRPDGIILDVMLPQMDGYQILRTLREEGNAVPVLMLTALGDEVHRVRGFRLGADQYLGKPFSVVELLARVESLVRPRGEPGTRRVERFGTVSIDVDAGVVTRNGDPVGLTPKAFDLLVALVDRRGAVATRHELMREVWAYDESVMSRTVDAHIAELRRKLEDDPGNPIHIITVWKRGYRLAV